MSLEIRQLNVAYREISVIRGASAILPAGKVTALIGCNGAGKSTLLKAVAGLTLASGEVCMSGTVLTVAERRQIIAYMPQDIGAISSLTLLEVVLLGRLRSLGMSVPAHLVDEAYRALDTFGLANLHTRTLDTVSGGQRQLVYLAQALFCDPQVLLLDEPTAALDLRHQLVVLETIRRHARENGAVVAIAMHDLTLAAQFADRMIGLDGGHIEATGTPSEVLTADRLRTMYGIEAEVCCSPSGRLMIMPQRATTERKNAEPIPVVVADVG